MKFSTFLRKLSTYENNPILGYSWLLVFCLVAGFVLWTHGYVLYTSMNTHIFCCLWRPYGSSGR
jgi:hypothetical protein